MLCDGCEEVSLGEGLAYGDCVFCSEPCFEAWFGGRPAAPNSEAVAAPQRARPETRTALRLVAVGVVAAGAALLGGEGAQARFFDPQVEPPGVAVPALCHKRRLVGGHRKRVTVRCGRRHVDPRPLPQRA
jgi:hypothetical protein